MSAVRFRLPAEERRSQILESVQSLFAEKGFHGTTTRELAEAAQVSEALLFKHFPTKEALYQAMVEYQCSNSCGEWEAVSQLEPGTETLVQVVRFIITRLVLRRSKQPYSVTVDRMLLRSLCEDGAYARVALGGLRSCLLGKINACLKVAAAKGDLTSTQPLEMGGWFTHHLSLMVLLLRLPNEPTVKYPVSDQKLIVEALTFCLRGLGLREELISRHISVSASTGKQRKDRS